ncbi:MAG: NAD(P)H-dependent glycerol-3-phosphate dehydrogenase [Candidatus Sericytochromatia bacterium]|nr:NAD(P)H-dependent glycerol-3-phosphate dehydrogenase [Candidatus Sericytochromatia bacterium]
MSKTLAPIGIAGGGSWGTALAQLIGRHGHAVLHWMRDSASVLEVNTLHTNTRYLPDLTLSDHIVATTSLKELASSCKLILLVIPCHSFRSVLRELGEHLAGDHRLIHASKGFEPHSFKRMSQIILEETCVRQIGVLSGPNLAHEVAQGQPSATTVASNFPAVIEEARLVLAGPTFRVYGNADIIGTEVGGALKNVMAIAAGLAAGLGFGENTKALLLTRGLAEIARFGAHWGAHPATFSGLSGIGDLMATCFSPLSRNYRVGLQLAQGSSTEEITTTMKQVAEGVNTTRAVYEYARRHDVYMPITDGVYQIVHEGVGPHEVLAQLMDNNRFTHEDVHGWS